MPERSAAKPLEWLPSARAAYLETLDCESEILSGDPLSNVRDIQITGCSNLPGFQGLNRQSPPSKVINSTS